MHLYSWIFNTFLKNYDNASRFYIIIVFIASLGGTTIVTLVRQLFLSVNSKTSKKKENNTGVSQTIKVIFIVFILFAIVTSIYLNTSKIYTKQDVDFSSFEKENINLDSHSYKYIGSIVNNIPHGKGAIYQDDFLYQVGYFKDGKLNGYGVEYDFIPGKSDNNLEQDTVQKKAEGNFVNDLYDGDITLYYQNGKEKYIGQCHFGKFFGKGEYWGYDINYNLVFHADGYYVNNKLNGFSRTEKYSDGKLIEKYVGNYYDGEQLGKGVYYYSENEIQFIFVGYFANNQRWCGVLYNNDGDIIEQGNYENNELTKTIDDLFKTYAFPKEIEINSNESKERGDYYSYTRIINDFERAKSINKKAIITIVICVVLIIILIYILIALFRHKSPGLGAVDALFVIIIFSVLIYNAILLSTGFFSYQEQLEDGYYIGQIKDDKISGWGAKYNNDKKLVEYGHYIDGNLNGYGRKMETDESIIESVKSTYGDKITSDVYIKEDGIYIDGVMNGSAKYYIPGSEDVVYEGDIINGERNGTGTLKEYNKDSNTYKQYKGSFSDDTLNGYGVDEWYYESGKVYRRYEGNHFGDKRYGYGILETSDDVNGKYIYCGNIINNELNGEGIVYNTNHEMIVSGRFSDGKLVENIEWNMSDYPCPDSTIWD